MLQYVGGVDGGCVYVWIFPAQAGASGLVDSKNGQSQSVYTDASINDALARPLPFGQNSLPQHIANIRGLPSS